MTYNNEREKQYNEHMNKIYEDEYRNRELEHKNEYEHKQAIFEYKRYEYNKELAEDRDCVDSLDKPMSELSAYDYSKTIKSKYPEVCVIYEKNIIKICWVDNINIYIQLKFSEEIGLLCFLDVIEITLNDEVEEKNTYKILKDDPFECNHYYDSILNDYDIGVLCIKDECVLYNILHNLIFLRKIIILKIIVYNSLKLNKKN